MLAKIMLGGFRVELVKDEICLTRDDPQVCFRGRVPERTLTTTDRAVAIDDIVELSSNLECDPTTMACALVGLDHSFIDRSSATRPAGGMDASRIPSQMRM